MHRPAFYDFDVSGLVKTVADELDYRRRAIDAIAAAEQRIAAYKTEVTAFVRCIYAGLFDFVEELDGVLRSADLGRATIRVRGSQPALTDHLAFDQDWSVRDFSVLRATLLIRPRLGIPTGIIRELSADVSFCGNEGVFRWRDGSCDFFRVDRTAAMGTSKFGPLARLDFLMGLGIKRRGCDRRISGMFRDEPEIIVARRLCLDSRWPGWREP
jgi:hypothetical protein